MTDPLRIDIVSDVMCPWCIIGYKQLEHALSAEKIGAMVHWHPFELNPNMPAGGQDLREHVAEKYGSTAEQSAKVRDHMTALGHDLGFDFRFTEDSRIRNTFRAHRVIHWAREQNMGHQMKLALFSAHFTDQKDVDDPDVLAEVAGSVGLDSVAALAVAQGDAHADEVRAHERYWIEQGVQGVPGMVFDGKYLVTGAQGVDTYRQVLNQVLANRAA